MNWPTIRDTLQLSVSKMTGLQIDDVVWAGSFAERSMVVRTRAILRANAVNTVGVDETRYQNSTNPLDDMQATRVGQRDFTLTVQIESQDQDPPGWARTLIDRVRALIQTADLVQLFASVGIAVSRFLGTQHFDYLASGRMVSASIMDIKMLGAEMITDATVGAGGWINEVLTASTPISGPDGQPLPSQINLDVRGS